MTDDEKSKETDRNTIFPTRRNLHYVDLTKKTSTYDPSYIRTVTPETTKKLKLNFSKRTALRCLDTIVQSNDIIEARNRIWANQMRGKTLQEESEEARGCTAGVRAKTRTYRFDYVCELKEKKDEETRIAMKMAAAYVTESRLKMNHVLVKNKPPSDWSIKNLTDITRVLKTKDDGAMTKKRPELWEMYLKCRSHSVDLMIYEQLFQTVPAVVVDTPEQLTVCQPAPPLAPAVDVDTPAHQPDPLLAPAVIIDTQSAPPLTHK